MKSLFVLSFLLSSSALASEVKLQPYFPSPFPGLPFALAPQCFLHGVSSDGEWHGMCHYYGGNPRNPGAYALVEWDTTGTALSATQCYLYSFQARPCAPRKCTGRLRRLTACAVGCRASTPPAIPAWKLMVPELTSRCC